MRGSGYYCNCIGNDEGSYLTCFLVRYNDRHMSALLQSTACIIRVCQPICKLTVHNKVAYNGISISNADLALAEVGEE